MYKANSNSLKSHDISLVSSMRNDMRNYFLMFIDFIEDSRSIQLQQKIKLL